MLPKVKALIAYSDVNIKRNNVLKSKKENEYQDIVAREDFLAQEIMAINKLSQGLYSCGVTNKERLFAIQRRQSTLKRKLADINMQVSQMVMAREHCEKEKRIIAERSKQLDRKMNKYQRLMGIERKKIRAKDVRIEEYEIEERISWKR